MTVFSLNDTSGQKQLLDYVTRVISKNIILSNRNYQFRITDEKKDSLTFKIKIHNRKNKHDDKNKTILLYIYTISHESETSDIVEDFCLKLELKGNMIKKGRNYFFEESYVYGIYKNKCAIKNGKSIMMPGKFIVKLVDKINKLFKVKTSKLLDDSRLPICLENTNNSPVMSLKTIKLLQNGQTWYEKEGGFKLDNNQIYEAVKKVQTIPLSSFLNIATNRNLHSVGESYIDYTEGIESKQRIERIETILKKINLSRENTFQEIATNIFNNKEEISDCEKLEIWEKIISNNLKREKVETTNQIPSFWKPLPSMKDIENYKLLMKWWDIGFGMEYSTKIYEYPIEKPRISRRPSTAFSKRPSTSRRPSTAFGRSVIPTTKTKTKTITPTPLHELAKPKNPRKKIIKKTKKTPVQSTAPVINNSNLKNKNKNKKKKKRRKNKKKKIN